MRLRDRSIRRTAATMAETGVVLLTFLIAVVGMIDLGAAILRQHIITEAAREGARIAAVHGALANTQGSSMNAWPPGSNYSGWCNNQPATNTSIEIINDMQPFLNSLVSLSNTYVTVSWPGSSNAVESQVEVKVQTTYTPMLSFIFNGSISLSAVSTMQISH